MPTPQEIEAEEIHRQSKGVAELTPEQQALLDKFTAMLPKADYSPGALARQAAAVTADALGENDGPTGPIDWAMANYAGP